MTALDALRQSPGVVVVSVVALVVGAVVLGLCSLLLLGLVILSKRNDPSRRLRVLIREVFEGIRNCRRQPAARTSRPARARSPRRPGAAGAGSAPRGRTSPRRRVTARP